MSTVDFTNLAPSKDADYIPSSEKKEEDTNLELRGKVEFKKKSWFDRMFSDFKKGFPYIFWKVIVPEAGSMAFDNITNLLRDSLFGGSSIPTRSSGRKRGYYNDMEYSDYYDARNGRRDNRRGEKIEKRSYDEFIFTNRLDVEDIIVALKKQAHRERNVSVSDLYYIIKKELKENKYPSEIIALLEQPEYTDTGYGWYYEDLQSARVEAIGRDRYCLDLPRAVAIK